MQLKALLVGTVAALATAGTLTACGSTNSASSTPPATSPTATSTTQTAMTRTGTFSGLNGKNVAGTATVDGSTVTLANYSSDQGPDLHIYLTNGTSEAAVAGGVELSKVAYNQASQTFTLPSGVHASMYTDIVIHCDKAKAVFGAAALHQ